MNPTKPPQIPSSYVFYAGEWCHPSRVPREHRLIAQCLNDGQSAPQTHGKGPTSDFDQSSHIKTPKRIRQSTKPLLNKLEQRFVDHLKAGWPDKRIIPQGITFRLANGVRYTPDVFCLDWFYKGKIVAVAWEVKGPWFTDDARVKIKLFATIYPEILVLLVSENKSGPFKWDIEVVLP